MSKRNFKVFTQEEKDFIFQNNYMKTAQEVTDLFNDYFNDSITVDKVKNFRNRYKIKSGLTGRFEKGQTSFNKGKKWDDYMPKEAQKQALKTTFKKGNIPANRREVFEERISKDGYIEIKVQDGKLNDNWQFKHRYIYEQENGKIPKDYIVSFADGNIKNFDINNLILVSRAENLILNRNDLRTNDTELTKTALNLAKVIVKINDIKKKDD